MNKRERDSDRRQFRVACMVAAAVFAYCLAVVIKPALSLSMSSARIGDVGERCQALSMRLTLEFSPPLLLCYVVL